MPVDFTPVAITIFRPINWVEKFIDKLPASDFKRLGDQCILFLTPECAKRFMRRFNHFEPLIKHKKKLDFDISDLPVRISEENPATLKHLTQSRRKKFPEYIIASYDGKQGFRCQVLDDGYIYGTGELIKLSGRKWRGTNFYFVDERKEESDGDPKKIHD